MILPPSSSTLTDTLFPYTSLFRSFGHVRRRRRVPDDAAPHLLWHSADGCCRLRGNAGDRRQCFRGVRPSSSKCGGYPHGQCHGWRGHSGSRHRRRALPAIAEHWRSEEHTSELQSLMRISYAVFCLKKKNTKLEIQQIITY